MQTLLLATFTSIIMLAAQLTSRAAEQTSAQAVGESKLFVQKIIHTGTLEPSTADTEGLAAAIIEAKRAPADEFSALEQFIRDFPNSPWSPSLRANLASRYRAIGRYSAALRHWKAVWEKTKDAGDANSKLIADQTIAEWTQLLARLGRLPALELLLKQTEGRTFSDQTYGRLYSDSRITYDYMLQNPRSSYRCGTFALYQIGKLKQLQGTALTEISQAASPTNGFSLLELGRFAQSAGLGLVAVKRTGGEIIVPSVVHWRENHYAAIVRKEGNKFYVIDATFGEPVWISGATINDETDGYFLIPEAAAASPSWSRIADEEAISIHGQGANTVAPPPYHPPCIPPPGQCCANRGSGGRGGTSSGTHGSRRQSGIWSGFGGRDSSGPSIWSGNAGSGRCSTCGGGSDKPSEVVLGMPTWKVTEPYIGLWLADKPMSTTVALEYELDLILTYNQEENRPDDTNIFNFGPNWNCNLLSYVDITSNDGSDAFTNYTATAYGPGGGQTSYNSTPPDQGYPPYSYYDNATFSVYTGLFFGVRLTYPSGAQYEYGYASDVSTSPKRKRLFLTKAINPAGRSLVEYHYSTSGGRVLLDTVSDDAGSPALTLYYSTVHPAQVVALTNMYGQGVTLAYETNRMLTNIVDAGGLSSSFTYTTTNSMTILTRLTTPYGDTSFEYVNPKGALYGGGGLNRAMRVIQPNGDTDLYMYRENSSGLVVGGTNYNFVPHSYSDVPDIGITISSTNGLCNDNMHYRNSFHWGPNQYAALSTTNLLNLSTNDYEKGTLKNWLHLYLVLEDTGALGETLNMQRDPSLDGLTVGPKTWYAYAGKYKFNVQSTNVSPSYIARLLPNGDTQYIYRQYNGLGNVTLEAATYSGPSGIALRTNNFVYSSDGSDLTIIYDRSGLPQSTRTYSSHLLTVDEDYLEHSNTFTYFANSRVASISRPSGLTTTNIYGSSGFLERTIDLEIFRTNSYTYSNGMLATHTDARGLIKSYKWDSLNRLISIGYPDGTYESNRYTRLDLTGHMDRLSNWTYYAYDSIRRKTAETNALGRVTSFSYCTCGSMDSVNDPLGTATHLYYDLAGRRVGTVYADGTWVSNRLDVVGRIVSQFDSAGTSVTNWYNHQGLLLSQTNNIGRVQSLSYDIEDRVTNSVDANGIGIGFRYDLLGRMDRRYPGNDWQEEFSYSYKGLEQQIDLGNRVTHFTLDAAGRKVTELDNNEDCTGYTYNPSGDLRFLTNGAGAVTRWDYDEYGRVTNKVSGISARYRYDAEGRLTNRWTAETQTTIYRYDAVGNLTNVDYTSSPDLSFSYDANNRLTNMIDASGTTSYTYTSFGAVASDDGPWSDDTITYTYANRLRTGMSLRRPSTTPLSMAYAYDNNRRLTTIASSTEGTFNYGYDPTMKLHVNRVGFPNGAYITNTFETMGQVTGTYLKDGSGTILNSHVYAYDPFNFKDISRQTRTDGSYVDYNYDGIGQLKSALGKEAGGSSRLNETFRYSYDHAGNLSHRTNDILDESFTVDTWDKLVSVTRSGRITVMGATSAAATNVTVNTSNATLYADNTFASTNHTLTATGFTAIAKDSYGRCDTNTVSNLPESVFVSYDDDGRLVNDGRLGFQYDEENQLIAVWDDVVASWKSEFVYDGKMRRRIRKEFRWQNGTWVQTNEVRYIYDGNVVIQERDAMNSLSVTYTRGPDLSRSFEGAGGIGGLLARRDDRAATPAYYHADRLGNVTMLISPQQIPVAKYFYDPFGTILSSSGPLADANLYRFSSKESHTLSGLTFYAMRYYSARMHRWLNPDPIQELGGINLSSFVGNSPVRAIDPFGLSFWDYVPLIGTIRGCTSNSEGSNPGDYATVPFPNCQECKTDPEGAEKKCRDRIAILSSRYNAVAQASGIFRGALDVVATTVGGILITRGGFVLGGVLTGYSVADVLCTFNSIFAIGNAAKQAADNFCQCEPKPKN